MSGKSFAEKLDKALVDAAVRGNASKVAELLSQGAGVDTRDEDGDTPLMTASYFGDTEVCEILLDNSV